LKKLLLMLLRTHPNLFHP